MTTLLERAVVARAGPWSVRVRRRDVLAGSGCLIALGIGCLWSLSSGDAYVPLGELAAVTRDRGGELATFLVVELRLPRLVVAVLVGLALGLSGALTQSFVRNPLASPDVLGLTEGAAFAAVLVIVVSGTDQALATDLDRVGVPVAALFGGLSTAAVIYLLAWRRGINGQRLVLIGIGIGALLAAGTSYLLVRARVWDAEAAHVWLTGSLAGRGWPQAVPLACSLLVLVPLALALNRTLRGLELGDDVAIAVGVRVPLAQLTILLVAVALASAAVASAGPILFVALAAPQIALRLSRASRPPLLASGLCAAALVVFADTAARVLLPTELPVGVVTAVLGAPYLMWLLIRTRRKANA